MRRNGIKGNVSNPRSRNHRLYCIRLERLSLNIRLAIKRIPMIPLINTLHIKKRIIKSATFNCLLFLTSLKEGSGGYLFLFQTVCHFLYSRQHGSDIPVIVSFQKRVAFLADVFAFFSRLGINKHSALFFISQNAFCYETFD